MESTHTNTPANPNCRLYVGNLGFSLTTDDVRNIFSTVGEVKDVFMPQLRNTQRHRGYAFVQMSEDWMVEKAIKTLNGTPDSCGRLMTIRHADVRKERTDIPLSETIAHNTITHIKSHATPEEYEESSETYHTSRQ